MADTLVILAGRFLSRIWAFIRTPLPTISRLILSSSPLTVFWTVIRVIIDSLNGVFLRWLRPHVSEEVLERMQPAVADSDASAAPILEIVGFRVVAAGFHVLPTTILRCVGHAVRSAHGHAVLTTETSTTSSVASRKGVSVNGRLGAAVALADPTRVFGRNWVAAQNHQPAVAVTTQVNKSWHGSQRITITVT